jgi:cysteine-rich repeat protein
MLTANKAKISILGLLLTAACTVDPSEETDSAQSANSDTCGNGVRDANEHCDDGNDTNLDGCSKTCRFEQVHRMNKVEMMFSADSFCTSNALGGAVRGLAQGQVQDALSAAVADGTMSILLAFEGLSDPTGRTPGPLTLGTFFAEPGTVGGVDTWYTTSPLSIDADRSPLAKVPAQVSGSTLTAGPGSAAFALDLGGSPVNLKLANARLKATLGPATAPLVSNGSSPGHLASEQLDPALLSFETTRGGQICGDVSAASLAAIPVPEPLTSGATRCSQGYTMANSMLDVLVGGCSVFFMTVIGATQPDKVDASAPAAGAGGPYRLTTGSGRKVTGCRDRNNASVPLDACLASAAYSAAFRFETQRVIAR